MPFEKIFPRSFNALSIRQFAPASPGVYGLSNAAGWIFIGETGSIQDALLEHLTSAAAAGNQYRPSGFVYEVCEHAYRSTRLERLIAEYSPRQSLHSPTRS